VASKGRLLTDSVEKVCLLTQSKFFGAVAAIFQRGRGGPHHVRSYQSSVLAIDLHGQLEVIEEVAIMRRKSA
jgi:hypothetical protein